MTVEDKENMYILCMDGYFSKLSKGKNNMYSCFDHMLYTNLIWYSKLSFSMPVQEQLIVVIKRILCISFLCSIICRCFIISLFVCVVLISHYHSQGCLSQH